MKVYRIEDENGEGPYINKFFDCQDWTDNEDKHGNEQTHPTRLEDMFHYTRQNNLELKEYSIDDFVCGFNSLEQLNNWFSEDEIDNLLEYEFSINEYEVDETYVMDGKSKRQIMFLKQGN